MLHRIVVPNLNFKNYHYIFCKEKGKVKISYALSFSDSLVILPPNMIDFDHMISRNFAKDSMFGRVFFFYSMRKS